VTWSRFTVIKQNQVLQEELRLKRKAIKRFIEKLGDINNSSRRKEAHPLH
jgi:hypothetical protein